MVALAPPVWLLGRLLDRREEPMTPVDAPRFAERWNVRRIDVRPFEVPPVDVQPNDDAPSDSDDRPRIATGNLGWWIESRETLDVAADVCLTPRVEWESASATAGGEPIDYAIRWRRRGDPTIYETSGRQRRDARPNEATASSRGGATQDADTDAAVELPRLHLHPAWKGRVEWIELRLNCDAAAPSAEPLTAIRAVGIPAATVEARCRAAARQWQRFEPISPTSINSILAPHPFGTTPVLLVAGLAVSAIAALTGLRILRAGRVPVQAILVMIAAAWLLSDARHLAAQWRQLDADETAPGAVASPSPDRAVAGPGHDSFGAAHAPPPHWPAAIRRAARLAEAVLPDGAVYAVAGGNIEAGDTRLRYWLAPRCVQVNVDPLQPRVAAERAEFVIVLNADAASFDTAGGRLAARGVPPMKAERMAALPDGEAIYRRVSP